MPTSPRPSLADQLPDIAAEWHPTRNEGHVLNDRITCRTDTLRSIT
jgi:hypothetical protein